MWISMCHWFLDLFALLFRVSIPAVLTKSCSHDWRGLSTPAVLPAAHSPSTSTQSALLVCDSRPACADYTQELPRLILSLSSWYLVSPGPPARSYPLAPRTASPTLRGSRCLFSHLREGSAWPRHDPCFVTMLLCMLMCILNAQLFTKRVQC